MPERSPSDGGGPAPPRPFWSGTIAFGLVSVPVNLYSAVRSARASLRMVAEDGTPLSRRYFCTLEDVPVDWDEIVRGYEIEKDQFVLVGDDELEELAPDKSREIDLRRFVPRDEIDPGRFDRPYVLAPDSASTKAYRLLARAMEDAGRAGIATFVMRGKEYLVAILAHNGLLLAETLRFSDELRSPDDVGLPAPAEPDAARVKALLKDLKALREKEIDRDELTDRGSHRLRNLVEAKLEEGDDVLHGATASAPADEDEDEAEAPLDLMQVLKRSLEEGEEPPARAARSGGDGRRAGGKGGGGKSGGERSGGKSVGQRSGGKGGGNGGSGDLAERTKAELYEQAKERGISGRSAMSKEELIEAIRG